MSLKKIFVYKNIKKYRIILHILFWFIYLISSSFIYGSKQGKYIPIFFEILIQFPVEIITAYFTVYYLIPKYLLTKKYKEFTLYFIISAFIFSFSQRLIYYYIIDFLFYPDYYKHYSIFNIYKILTILITTYYIVAVFSSIKLVRHWYENQRANQELAKEKLEAELKYLKNQVHPHFLFNTLNNLYALTLKKSDNAKNVVLKLSELLSYMLYDASAKYVPLSKEIEYLQNYIALEKIRFGKRFEISFNTFGNVSGISIAPLLIIPFIENSFKHGVSSEVEGAWITIEISIKESILTIKIENSKNNQYIKNREKDGLGILNVKRRLELLYHNEYDLKIVDEETSYLVILKITIKKD